MMRILVVLDKDAASWNPSANTTVIPVNFGIDPDAFRDLAKNWENVESIESFSECFFREEKRLKKEFLQWVYTFPLQTLAEGRMIKDYLQEGPFNYWWGSPQAEKNPLKNDTVFFCLKSMLLEEMIREQKGTIDKVVLTGGSNELETVLSFLCKEFDLPFHREASAPCGTGHVSWKEAIKQSPVSTWVPFAKAAWSNILCRRNGFGNKEKPLASTVVFTYYPNRNDDAAAKGVFASNYWGEVQHLLDEKKAAYVFFPIDTKAHRFAKTVREARLFRNSYGKERFFLFAQFLSLPKLALEGVKTLRCALRNKRLMERDFFKMEGRKLNLYPFLVREWHEAVCGGVYAWNRIWALSFREMIQRLQPSSRVIYLMEMYGWEGLLNQAVGKFGMQTESIGVIHTAVKPMNLKYFNDNRSYEGGDFPFPLPTRVAVNGEHARELFLSQGVPKTRLVSVEAQRYTYLSNQTQQKQEKRILLVATSVSADESDRLLALLSETCQKGCGFDQIILKCHPFYDASKKAGTIQGVPLEITTEPMTKLLEKSAAVLATAGTSVVAEALMKNLHVIVPVDMSHLPLLPVEDHPLLSLVYDKEGLVEALKSEKEDKTTGSLEKYFYLDNDYTRWKKVLEMT